MIRDFFRSKNRASHLENQVLNKKFDQLEALLQKFPIELCSHHQLNDSEDIWPEKGSQKAKSWEFIKTGGPNQFNDICAEIKPLLRKVLLYKK